MLFLIHTHKERHGPSLDTRERRRTGRPPLTTGRQGHDSGRWFAGMLRLAVIAALSAAPGVPPSATAQTLTGMVLVQDELSPSATFSKEIQLDCPPGKVAVSGGGSLTGAVRGGQALYQSLPIFDPPSSWQVVGRDVDGGGTEWGLRASLWCADPPPGLERVTETLPLSSFSPKEVIVDCPAGKATIGGGAAIVSTSASSVGINEITILATENWRFGGVELYPDGGEWALRGTVLCADVEPSLRHRSVDRALSSFMSTEMYCPDGTFALAGGGEVFPSEAALTANTVGTTFAPFWFVAASQPGSTGAVSELDLTLLCHPTSLLFQDGFEGGSTGRWSNVLP